MYTLRPDEKTTPVMVYTQNSVVRGDVVTKQSVIRINIWLRTEGAPRYLHILKPQVLVFGGSPAKSISYAEIYFPIPEAIAFHTLPPTDEPMDYDASEANRAMQPIDLLVGTFVIKGKIRISTQTDIGTSLESARITWMSVYDVLITNPYLPQMPALQAPIILVSPNHVVFGLL